MNAADDVVFAIDLGEDVRVLGEWVHADEPRAIVIGLHDNGRDLDTLRPFAKQLKRLNVMTMLVDLPGHGLSSGSWEEDGEQAVAAVLDHCSRMSLPVSVLTIGSAAQLVLAQPVSMVSLVAVGPSLTETDLGSDSPWRSTPMLTITDPTDVPSTEAQALLGRWSRGWYVRMNGHYLSDEALDAAWVPQVTHIAAAFAAEQFAYHCAGRTPDATTSGAGEHDHA